MKTAFIVPTYSIVSDAVLKQYEWDKMWEYRSRQRLWSCPSLSLLTVAGMLPPDKFEMNYLDYNYQNNESLAGYELAFFSPSTTQITEAARIAAGLRQNGVITVAGGPHVSFASREAGQFFDTIFVGECEETFSIFLEDIRRGKPRPVYVAPGFADLKQTPPPRYDLMGNYPYKSIPLQLSRGCPHKCKFCVSSKLYGPYYRRKDFEQVSRELESIMKIRPQPFVFFTDDNIFLDKAFSNSIIDLLVDLPIRWYAFSDARIAGDERLLEKIARSGCTQLLIGFESLSDDNLVQINPSRFKKSRRQDYSQIIERIQAHGIGVVGSFVIGLDNDTPAVFEELYSFIERTNLYATNITVVTPFVGTDLYEEMKRDKRITTDDWSLFNGFELTFKAKQMDSEQFEQGMNLLYKKLNSNARISKVMMHFKEIFRMKEHLHSVQAINGLGSGR